MSILALIVLFMVFGRLFLKLISAILLTYIVLVLGLLTYAVGLALQH